MTGTLFPGPAGLLGCVVCECVCVCRSFYDEDDDADADDSDVLAVSGVRLKVIVYLYKALNIICARKTSASCGWPAVAEWRCRRRSSLMEPYDRRIICTTRSASK